MKGIFEDYFNPEKREDEVCVGNCPKDFVPARWHRWGYITYDIDGKIHYSPGLYPLFFKRQDIIDEGFEIVSNRKGE